MDGPLLGVAVTVFAVLLSQRMGWDATRGRALLALAGVAFSVGLLLPAVAVGARRSGEDCVVAGGVATAVGALLLVWGVLRFERRA